MSHDYDKHTFDRVSDTNDERNPLGIHTELQDVQNEYSDTNNTDNINS